MKNPWALNLVCLGRLLSLAITKSYSIQITRTGFEMDGVMLEFPLCCLSYPEEEKKKVGMIISYCIVEHSKKVTSFIHKRIRELEKELPSDFEDYDELHSKVVLAADELAIIVSSIKRTLLNHTILNEYINDFIVTYGKDAYCRIGKKVCFETRDGTFNYSAFTVLCAIQSILGKTKQYCRIIKDRIRYRMHGYKTKSIAEQEMKDKTILLTDRQLGNRINILYGKNFFSKFTYAQRQTFYSTRLSDEQLRDKVKESKIYWAERKAGVNDKIVTSEIKTKLKIIKLNSRKGA